MSTFDPRIVARAPASALRAVGYRNQSPGFDPRSGIGARRFGGRYNPPNSFPVLYLCTTRSCVGAELTRQAQRQGLQVGDLLPRGLYEITADLTNVLDLTNGATIEALGVQPADLVRDDRRLTEEIGEAAHEHGFQAILSRSATGVDEVLALFPENLAGAVLQVELVGEWTSPQDLGAAGG